LISTPQAGQRLLELLGSISFFIGMKFATQMAGMVSKGFKPLKIC